jgi:salicylate hydroxylase
MVQAESRKNGLRYDSKYADLAQRDREIANIAVLRRSLYDHDIEKEALESLSVDLATT